jgi:hypothetical protein
VGRAKKPGMPGKTTIPRETVSQIAQKLRSTFNRFQFHHEFHFVVVPQQCYLYLEVAPVRDGHPAPSPDKGSTTHKPLGRLMYLGTPSEWEYQPYRRSNGGWDARNCERGTASQLLLAAMGDCC